MKAIVFNKCSPCTSDPGLLHFHHLMFHGILEPDRPEDGTQAVLRNAFQEPPVILPTPMILVWPEVYQQLSKVVRAAAAQVEDAFVYYLPYQLGEIPEHLTELAPWIEKDILRRDEKLLPKARSFAHRYVAIKRAAIMSIDPQRRALATGLHPYWNEVKTHSLVSDERLVDDLGIIGTAFGYQVSAAAWEILKPLVPLPYFRWTEIDV